MSETHLPKLHLSHLLLACLSLSVRPTQAQQPAPSPTTETPAQSATSPPNVTTLDKIQALPPDEQAEALNLYQFKNPVSVSPNQFNKAYDTGITPEQMALKYGGYVNYGINKGLYIAIKGLGKLIGTPPQIQSATARPPPLNVEQMDRATRLDAEGTPPQADGPKAAPPRQ